MSIAIVGGALFRLAKDLIGLRGLLEHQLRGLITWVAVGVMLQRRLTVGGLNLHLGHGAFDAQNLVIVAFSRHVVFIVRCTGWWLGSLFETMFRPWVYAAFDVAVIGI